MSQSRKYRGYASQRILANYLKANGFDHAEPVGAGRAGTDITGTKGIDWEVKARAKFDPKGTMDQLADRQEGLLGIAVLRLNGQGEASVGNWCAILTLADLVKLLKEVGYK